MIPIFFVVSGARLDVNAIIHAPELVLCLVGLMAVIRGLPQFVLYRRALPDWRERTRFSLYVATGLPVIIALVTIEVQAGAMLPVNGSALICAGALSVLVFPLVGDLLVRGRSHSGAATPQGDQALAE
jgi:Kef-type K+ transport system membrane component KefB